MKRTIFIGACVKTDLMLYIGKILSAANQKVLLVDATLAQKYRYSISMIDDNAALTEFDSFDIAMGFKSYVALEAYFKQKNENLDAYDILLIDTDDHENVDQWGEAEHRALVTNFERYTLLQNVKLLEQYFQGRMNESLIDFIRIYYPYADCRIDENYIDSTVDKFPINWHEDAFDFRLDEVDYGIRVDNQYENRVLIKGLSRQYKAKLLEICEAITGFERKSIKLALKRVERGI